MQAPQPAWRRPARTLALTCPTRASSILLHAAGRSGARCARTALPRSTEEFAVRNTARRCRERRLGRHEAPVLALLMRCCWLLVSSGALLYPQHCRFEERGSQVYALPRLLSGV
jgi:hypothetical protein